ncbi:MAG: type II secretion system major pseudopilin GspG [Verrucomicrobiales bacterium]
MRRDVKGSGLARGFSLFEMVIVMGIIGVILGSAIYMMGGIGDSAKIQTARRDFQAIQAGLDTYKMNGRKGYPTTQQGLEALVSKPGDSPIPRDWSQTYKEVPLDPWQVPYDYKLENGKPVIISAGPDGQMGTDDDLSSADE